MTTNTNATSSVMTFTNFLAALATIILVALTLYSLFAERSKELTIIYTEPRALVTLDGHGPSAGLEVTLNGAKLKQPWIVSARVENSGNQVIEARNVEVPITLTFGGAIIVGAEIVQRSEAALYAQIEVQGEKLKVDHRLLNPGDWFSIDIIFDGPIKLPPSADYRISGVRTIHHQLTSSAGPQRYLTLFAVPSPIVYVLISTLSLLAIGLFVGGVAVIVTPYVSNAPFQGKSKSEIQAQLRGYLDRAELVRDVRPLSRGGAILGTLIEIGQDSELIDNRNALERAIAQQVPDEVLNKLGVNRTDAGEILREEWLISIRDNVADKFYQKLTTGDRVARDAVYELDTDGLTLDELFNRAVSAATDALSAPRTRDTGEVAGALTLLGLGAVMIFVLGGTWRSLLGW